MTRQRRDTRQSAKQPREEEKQAPEKGCSLSLPHQKNPIAASIINSPYLRRKVHGSPRPGVSPSSDIQGPVRLLLVVVAVRSSGLRRIVSRGSRSSRVITFAARPADEWCPEPVAAVPAPRPGEPAVAPSWPRRPAEGGEAVGKGLEALAEVGLWGHMVFCCCCWGAKKE